MPLPSVERWANFLAVSARMPLISSNGIKFRMNVLRERNNNHLFLFFLCDETTVILIASRSFAPYYISVSRFFCTPRKLAYACSAKRGSKSGSVRPFPPPTVSHHPSIYPPPPSFRFWGTPPLPKPSNTIRSTHSLLPHGAARMRFDISRESPSFSIATKPPSCRLVFYYLLHAHHHHHHHHDNNNKRKAQQPNNRQTT